MSPVIKEGGAHRGHPANAADRLDSRGYRAAREGLNLKDRLRVACGRDDDSVPAVDVIDRPAHAAAYVIGRPADGDNRVEGDSGSGCNRGTAHGHGSKLDAREVAGSAARPQRDACAPSDQPRHCPRQNSPSASARQTAETMLCAGTKRLMMAATAIAIAPQIMPSLLASRPREGVDCADPLPCSGACARSELSAGPPAASAAAATPAAIALTRAPIVMTRWVPTGKDEVR